MLDPASLPAPDLGPVHGRCPAAAVGEAGGGAHRRVVGVLSGVAQHPLHLGEHGTPRP